MQIKMIVFMLSFIDYVLQLLSKCEDYNYCILTGNPNFITAFV